MTIGENRLKRGDIDNKPINAISRINLEIEMQLQKLKKWEILQSTSRLVDKFHSAIRRVE